MGTLSMARIGLSLNKNLFSMNYRNRNTLRVLQSWGSACFVHIENYQRGSPQQKHLGINLAAIVRYNKSQSPKGGEK
jgi:hypothetical protein